MGEAGNVVGMGVSAMGVAVRMAAAMGVAAVAMVVIMMRVRMDHGQPSAPSIGSGPCP